SITYGRSRRTHSARTRYLETSSSHVRKKYGKTRRHVYWTPGWQEIGREAGNSSARRALVDASARLPSPSAARLLCSMVTAQRTPVSFGACVHAWGPVDVLEQEACEH